MSRFSETAVKASMKMYFFYYSLMCHRGRPTWQVKSGIATLVALRILSYIVAKPDLGCIMIHSRHASIAALLRKNLNTVRRRPKVQPNLALRL